MKRELKNKKFAQEKEFIKARASGLNQIDSVHKAFPDLSENYAKTKGVILGKREDIQRGIIAEIEKKIPGKWAVDILRQKIKLEGNESIKALSLYFDLVGAKKTEHLVKSESKNVNFNINIEGEIGRAHV